MSDRPVAIITGAGGGIGTAAAVEFARRGYDLALSARQQDELDAAVSAAATREGRIHALAGDLADLSFAQSLVASTANTFGRIDALVNNAAWREIVTMREISTQSWEKTLRICLTAPAFLCRWAAEHMEQRGRGVIVNVSSTNSRRSAGIAPAYVAAKGAMDALTGELAALYGPRGVRVVCVNPGAIDTEMARSGYEAARVEQEIREYTEQMIPLGRWGHAREVADVIAWLASDQATYVNGTCITVDGGWSRQLLPLPLKKQMKPDQF